MQSGGNVAMVATLPELMPEDVAVRLLKGSVVPLNGLSESIAAVEAAAKCVSIATLELLPLVLSGRPLNPVLIPEAEAKTRLEPHGVTIPRLARASTPQEAANLAAGIGFPVVLKGEGIAHKTEAGAVVLNLSSAAEISTAAKNMPASNYLIEEMISDTIVELLIGVVRDPAHGFVLTLAAGGILTELMRDSASLLVPAGAHQVETALNSLRIAQLLKGFRGKPAADISAIVATIMAVQDYVQAHAENLEELEINPLLCCPTRAVAADTLIRQEEP